jgi:histidyl-tRNA synthetase
MRQANALGIHYVVIVGEDELEREQVSVRDMVQGDQEVKPMAQFFDELVRG